MYQIMYQESRNSTGTSTNHYISDTVTFLLLTCSYFWSSLQLPALQMHVSEKTILSGNFYQVKFI